MPIILDHCQSKPDTAACRVFFRHQHGRWCGGYSVLPLGRVRANLSWTSGKGRFKWDEYRIEPEAGFFHADATADKVAAASASVKATRQAAARKAVATRRARLALLGQAAG